MSSAELSESGPKFDVFAVLRPKFGEGPRNFLGAFVKSTPLAI